MPIESLGGHLSAYNEKDYMPILVRSIRKGVPITFDCYVLLTRIQRVFHWVTKGKPFPEDKLERIQSRNVEQLYIRIEEKEAYFAYLDQYLSTPEGQDLLEEIKTGQVEALEGLPDPEEYTLKSLSDSDTGEVEVVEEEDQVESLEVSGDLSEEVGEVEVQEVQEEAAGVVEVTGTLEEEPSDIVVKGSAEEDLGEVEVKGGNSQEDLGQVVVSSSAPVEGPLGEMISALKAELQDLESISVTGGIPNEESKTIIKDCTLKIEDELIRITGSIESTDEVSEQVVHDFEKAIQNHIEIVRGQIGEDDFGLVKPFLDGITQEFGDVKTHVKEELLSTRKMRTLLRKVKLHLDRVKRGSEFDKQALLSRSFNRMIRQTEEHLGEKISLESHVGEYGEIPEYLKRQMKLDDVMDSSSDDIKMFQHKILKQSLIIQDLTSKYNTAKSSLKTLRDKWFVFHVQAKKNLDPSDRMAANTIEMEFEKFETDFTENNSNAKTLLNVTSNLVQEMGGKHIHVDPDLLSQIGALSEEEQEKLKSHIESGKLNEESEATEVSESDAKSEVSTESQEELSESTEATKPTEPLTLKDVLEGTEKEQIIVGEQVDDSELRRQYQEEIAKIQSEMEVLKVQLENSQSLVESGNEKIKELTNLMESNKDLISKLEDENTENRRVIDNLENKVEQFQSSETTFYDTMSDANRKTQLAEGNSEVYLERIAAQQTELDNLKKELVHFQQGQDSDSLIKAKDEQIQALHKTLHNKLEDLNNLKSENIKNLHKVSTLEQKLRHVSHKFTRALGEQEALKSQNRAATAKATSSAQALKQTQRTVDKLTVMTENLRKERQKYIRTTNENLAKYKNMMTEANMLNKVASSSKKTAEDLVVKMEQMKEVESNLRQEISQWKIKFVDQQKAIEEMERQLRSQRMNRAG